MKFPESPLTETIYEILAHVLCYETMAQVSFESLPWADSGPATAAAVASLQPGEQTPLRTATAPATATRLWPRLHTLQVGEKVAAGVCVGGNTRAWIKDAGRVWCVCLCMRTPYSAHAQALPTIDAHTRTIPMPTPLLL